MPLPFASYAAMAVSTVFASAEHADLALEPGNRTEGEHDDGSQDAEHDDDDEKFDKGEPIFPLASGLLALDFAIPLYHFVAFR